MTAQLRPGAPSRRELVSYRSGLVVTHLMWFDTRDGNYLASADYFDNIAPEAAHAVNDSARGKTGHVFVLIFD